jgi:hypothetical protein
MHRTCAPTPSQPGKGADAHYSQLTCAEVTRAALADGCHRRLDCFPGSEKPRRLVPGRRPRIRLPLVSDPLQGRGLWRHKPDQTAARNTDNSNRVIVNPETCDRGPYTHFCGYFLHVSDPGAQDPIVRQFSPTGNGGWNRVSRGGSEELSCAGSKTPATRRVVCGVAL